MIRDKRNLTTLLVLVIYPIAYLLLLHPIIIERGIPFAGDVTTYVPTRSPLDFYSWEPGRGPHIALETVQRLLIWVFATLLGQEIAVKVYYIIIGSLSGVTTYFATKTLIKHFGISAKRLNFIAVASGFFYMCSFTNPALLNPGSSMTWVYIAFPLALLFTTAYLDKGHLKYSLLLALTILLGNPQPVINILVLVVGALYYLLLLLFLVIRGNKKSEVLHITVRLLLIIVVIIAVNAYWLVPNAIGYIKGFRFAQVYTTERLISLGQLKFLSHWKLLDVLFVGESSYYFFWHHPRNYTALNVIIPLLSASAILLLRRDRGVIYLSLILLVGIFLTKGVWPPVGKLYYYIASSIPHFGAYLRNPTKFAPMVILPYAILVSLAVDRIVEMVGKVGKSGRGILIRKLGAASLLVALLLQSVLYGTVLDLSIQTWHSYLPTYIPSVYDKINNWLSSKFDNYKVMWVPEGGAYVWKPYLITGFPSLISSKPAVSPRQIYPGLLTSTTHIGDVLKVLGVKYLIFHGDSINYRNEEVLQNLLSQKDLRVVYKTFYEYVPRDNSGAPLPKGKAGIVFNHSVFKLASPKYIPRGKEVDLIIKYVIPESISKKGFKGRFSIRFNIALEVYEAGETSKDKRVFWTTVYKQVMINETAGYAYFKVKIPYEYPGTAVDVYAWFYDGSFKRLTPTYFIARLPVVPNYIEIPFIVFENKKYIAPVYVTNGIALAYDLSITDIINNDILDTLNITKHYSLVFMNSKTLSNEYHFNKLMYATKAFIYSGVRPPIWLEKILSNHMDNEIKIIIIPNVRGLNIPEEEYVKGPHKEGQYVYGESPLIPLKDYVLSRGESNLVSFKYRLPDPVTKEGFKGRFWAGFGIILLGYPHGVAPPLEQRNKYRVFETTIHNYTLINDYEGFVTFNITIPKDFKSSAVDVYAWFYDGSFKRISPIYYVGTFKVRGVTFLKSTREASTIHIINDTLPLTIYVPKNGCYKLMLNATGYLQVNGTRMHCNGLCAINLSLDKGFNTIYISSDSEAYVRSIVFVEIPAYGEKTIPIIENAYIMNYKMLSPVEWEVIVNASKPFVLVFTEPYDKLWIACVDNRGVVKSVPLFNLVNGFLINSTGILHIRLYYTLQTYYVLGAGITLASFIALILLSTREYLKKLFTKLKIKKII